MIDLGGLYKAFCGKCVDYAKNNKNHTIKFDDKGRTLFRDLNCDECAEKDQQCIVICCECGAEYESKIDILMEILQNE